MVEVKLSSLDLEIAKALLVSSFSVNIGKISRFIPQWFEKLDDNAVNDTSRPGRLNSSTQIFNYTWDFHPTLSLYNLNQKECNKSIYKFSKQLIFMPKWEYRAVHRKIFHRQLSISTTSLMIYLRLTSEI